MERLAHLGIGLAGLVLIDCAGASKSDAPSLAAGGGSNPTAGRAEAQEDPNTSGPPSDGGGTPGVGSAEADCDSSLPAGESWIEFANDDGDVKIFVDDSVQVEFELQSFPRCDYVAGSPDYVAGDLDGCPHWASEYAPAFNGDIDYGWLYSCGWDGTPTWRTLKLTLHHHDGSEVTDIAGAPVAASILLGFVNDGWCFTDEQCGVNDGDRLCAADGRCVAAQAGAGGDGGSD